MGANLKPSQGPLRTQIWANFFFVVELFDVYQKTEKAVLDQFHKISSLFDLEQDQS